MAPREKLAIEGGPPVRSTFLPFGAPCLGEEEIAEVVDTLRSGWIGTGPKTHRFERAFAQLVGARYAVAVNSCSSALHLSLIVAGIGPGDEVITTPLTFAATANAIEHVGARPVFVDIDRRTLNIDPQRIADALTPRTRAIVPVHFGGLPCPMDEIGRLAAEHRLIVIEDAAHALGARYRGRMIGSLSAFTCFSFYANKNVTTAEGGMVTTGDPTIDERLRRLRLHGLRHDAWQRFQTRRFMPSDVIEPGFKYNMPDLAAALGLAQLPKLESFLEAREKIARRYDEAFADLPVRTQPRPSNGDRHALHLYVLILEPGRFRVHRNAIIEALRAENIGAALHYRALHTHPYYREKYHHRPEDFPEALRVGEHILSLPLTPAMNDQDVDDVIRAVHKVLRAYLIE